MGTYSYNETPGYIETSSSMETTGIIFILLIIVGVIIQIWLVYLFVNMARDVKEINKNLQKKENNDYSWADFNIDMILGRKDVAYEKIVRDVYTSMHTVYENWGQSAVDFNAELIKKAKEKGKAMAERLGRQLPPQLESYQEFCACLNNNKDLSPLQIGETVYYDGICLKVADCSGYYYKCNHADSGEFFQVIHRQHLTKTNNRPYR